MKRKKVFEFRQVRLADDLIDKIEKWGAAQRPTLNQTQSIEVVVRHFFGEKISITPPVDKK